MIVRTAAGDVQTRSELTMLLENAGLGRITGAAPSAGVMVTDTAIASIPAAHKAVTFAAQSVAILGARGMPIWRDTEAYRERVRTVWQHRLFSGVPNAGQTWFGFFEALQASIEWRNIGYYWKSRGDSGQIAAMYALHPDQVQMLRHPVSKAKLFKVVFRDGYIIPPECRGLASVTVDESVVREVRGRGGIGELVPLTPVEMFRTSLGVAIALQRREAHVLENGVHAGLLIKFPQTTTEAQARAFKKIYNEDNAGPMRAGVTKVIGGGAEMTQIGMTQRDAQFIESATLSVIDISNIFDVPPWFLGVNEKAEKTQLPEHEEARWFQHGLLPRLLRLEAALYSDSDLFGPGSKVYPAFDTENVVVADIATMDAVYHNRIQDGRLLVDDWRRSHGLPPIPPVTKDTPPGMIPQITPVGGAPNQAAQQPNGE